MRIAIVVDTYDDMANGTTVSARRFVNELRKRGHYIRVLSFSNTPEPDKVIFDEYHIPILQFLIERNRANIAKPDKEKFREAFKDMDFVHIFTPLPFGTSAAKTAYEMGIPVFMAFHMHPGSVTYNVGIKYIPFIEPFLFWLMRKKSYCYTTDIHCPTKFVYDTLRAHKFTQDLHIISNGFDDKKYYPMEVNKPKEWQNKFVVMCVGRLANEKKSNIAIKAVAKSKYKDKIKLVMAGTGPKKKSFMRLARKLKLDAEFNFYTQEELPIALNAADLYVHCSQIEIESISCMEAFATGLVPVIGDSKKSATHQFALDERSKFKDCNPWDLAAKIDYWIEHPEELKIMSSKYAAYALNFKLEKSIDKIEKVYKSFLLKYPKAQKEAALVPDSIEDLKLEPLEDDFVHEKAVL